MKNILKQVFKVLIFIIVFFILISITSNILVLKENWFGSDVKSFYKLEENSLDLLFLGSSHSYAAFSPEIIEKEFGKKSYNWATQQQPIYISYHYLVEALKTQKPKIVVLEAYMLTIQDDYAGEGTVRSALDRMNMSLNKIKAIEVSVENKEDYLSYYINIIKYHSRYSEIKKQEVVDAIKNKTLSNRGFTPLESNPKVNFDNSKCLNIEYTSKISTKNLEYLNKIIKLCNEENIRLVLVTTPTQMGESEQAYLNYVEKVAIQNNIEFIDLNRKFGEIGLDFSTDFYDTTHLSKFGAEKVTKYFLNNIL